MNLFLILNSSGRRCCFFPPFTSVECFFFRPLVLELFLFFFYCFLIRIFSQDSLSGGTSYFFFFLPLLPFSSSSPLAFFLPAISLEPLLLTFLHDKFGLVDFVLPFFFCGFPFGLLFFFLRYLALWRTRLFSFLFFFPSVLSSGSPWSFPKRFQTFPPNCFGLFVLLIFFFS